MGKHKFRRSEDSSKVRLRPHYASLTYGLVLKLSADIADLQQSVLSVTREQIDDVTSLKQVSIALATLEHRTNELTLEFQTLRDDFEALRKRFDP